MFHFNVAQYSTEPSDYDSGSDISTAFDAPELDDVELLANIDDANEANEWLEHLQTQPAAAAINVNLNDIFDAETIAPQPLSPDLGAWFDGHRYRVPTVYPEHHRLDAELLACALNCIRVWGLDDAPRLPTWAFCIDLTDTNKNNLLRKVAEYGLMDNLHMFLAARSIFLSDHDATKRILLRPHMYHLELASGPAGMYMSVMYDEVCRQRRHVLATENNLQSVCASIETCGKTAASWANLLQMFNKFLCPEYHRVECAVFFLPELYRKILSFLPMVPIGPKEQFLYLLSQ